VTQWTRVPFDEAVIDATGGNAKVLTGNIDSSGKYPVIDQGQQTVAGYVNDIALLCRRDKRGVILFGDHTRTLKYVDFDFVLGADGVKVLEARDDFSPRFLFHFLGSVSIPANRGYSRHFKYLKRLTVPRPPLGEQYCIAAVLDKADAIRRKRREVLKLADEFMNAAFLDLFGDPVTNPKGWPKDSFGNLGTLDRGKSRHRPRDEPALYGGSHPFIQTGDVANCDGVVRQHTQSYSDLGLSQSRKWPAGTLAITIAANIGKTGILGFDACFPDSVVGFTAKPPVSAEFIQFWLGQIQNRLEETAPQSAQKNINLEILRDLPVPIPTDGLLKQFTTLVQRARQSKLRQESLLQESDLLFGSIQQRAFNGQLATS
jgi:restriction endonuclease S subunit